ncbi:MAG TPA: hypothetical protein ENN09_03695 [Planctomycetes bacterium]|nr:hypothetical protein [Planctomycetota bacterium]
MAGLVGASIADEDLTRFVGAEIGAAVTGEEDVPFPLLVVEGFGELAMSEGAVEVLKKMEGRPAAVSGRTQIRAGAVRPELIAAVDAEAEEAPEDSFRLQPGRKVRLLRPPYFGRTGEVAEIPQPPEELVTGAKVPVVRVYTGDKTVTVPRANVELII